jgi:hypothetical protein
MTGRGDRLESWKEISAYLERTSRTCQKWEVLYGLPIHRLDETPKARVYAFRSELDDWLERILRETEPRDAPGAPADSRPAHASLEPVPDMPLISPSAVANKAYWVGRKAIDRFLPTRDPAELAVAVDMFEKVRAEDPENHLGYLGLGDAYRWDYSFLGMKPDRLRLMTLNYARARELAPDSAEATIGLGWSRYFPGDFGGAGELFVRAGRIRPHDPGVDLEIGNFLIGLGHLDRAIRRFTHVLDDPKTGPRARWLRALCREWTGDHEAALADVRKALLREPTSAYLRCILARLMVHSGDLAEAEAELTVAAALSRGGGDVEFNKALLAAARGDRKAAEDALAWPARATVLRNYIETMVYASLGDLDESLDLIELTIETGFSRLVTSAYPYLYLANPRNRFYDRLRRTPRFAGILSRQKRRYEEESARLGEL